MLIDYMHVNKGNQAMLIVFTLLQFLWIKNLKCKFAILTLQGKKILPFCCSTGCSNDIAAHQVLDKLLPLLVARDKVNHGLHGIVHALNFLRPPASYPHFINAMQG